MEDWQLIQEFAAKRSEAAFESIVARHAALVHSVALRHVNNSQLAEDVAQAVFILLARKAGSLRQGTVLSGWLFQTTRFVAQRAVRCEQRRMRREQEAMMMHEHSSADQTWQRIAPAVDDALGHLRSGDRDALMLRFFEGRDLRDVGAGLGVGEEAAKKRVARALDKLRSILIRRGWHLSTTLLAAAMTQQASAQIAPNLAAQLSASVLASDAPASATALANQVLAAWRWAKLKIAAGIGATAVSVAIVVFIGARSRESASANAVADPVTVPSANLPLADSPIAIPDQNAETNSQMKVLRFRTVSAESGAPIGNVRIGEAIWADHKVDTRWDLKTDAAGWCQVPYPSETGRLDVGAVADGWSAKYATWPAEGQSGFASEYTIRLQPVTDTLGGWVRDSSGRPVPNVEISFVSHDTTDYAHRERPRERFGFLTSIPATRTDASGKWSIGFVAPRHRGFQIEARHPDFAPTSVVSSDAHDSLVQIEGEVLQQLWSGTLITTLNAAYALTGTVVDEKNTPISGARIQKSSQSEIFTTDPTGVFRIPGLHDGTWAFTFSADGFAPNRTNLQVGAGMQPPVVTLQTGAVLRILVLDEYGNGIPDATVGMEQWGEHRDVIGWRERTDNDGRLEWHSAPHDAELDLYSYATSYCWTRNVKVKADGEEHVVRLRHVLEVYGRVTDSERGFGIRDFRAIPGYGHRYSYDTGLSWFGGETVRGSNGLFKLTFRENSLPWRIRIVADGYEEWTSEALTNPFSINLDIPLKPSALEESVRGVVLRPDGSPAPGVQLALLSLEHNVQLRNFKFIGNSRWLIDSDEKGEFRFTVNRSAHSVAAVSREGYAHLRVRDTAQPVTLQLQPWGQVDGVVDQSARAHPLATIELYDPAADNYPGRVRLEWYRDIPDVDGRFTFEFVPPGEFSVFINSNLGIPYHHQTPIVVKPGETAQVTIVEPAGALIRGRLVAPADKPINWGKDIVLAQMELATLRFAPGWSSKDENTLAAVDYWTSPAARRYVNSQRMISLRVADDGTFVSVEHVPAGDYQLVTVVRNNASVRHKITITPEHEQLPHFDLGAIELR